MAKPTRIIIVSVSAVVGVLSLAFFCFRHLFTGWGPYAFKYCPSYDGAVNFYIPFETKTRNYTGFLNFTTSLTFDEMVAQTNGENKKRKYIYTSQVVVRDPEIELAWYEVPDLPIILITVNHSAGTSYFIIFVRNSNDPLVTQYVLSALDPAKLSNFVPLD